MARGPTILASRANHSGSLKALRVGVGLLTLLSLTRVLLSLTDVFLFPDPVVPNNIDRVRPLQDGKTNEAFPKILVYITTHLSDTHIRYFHCCWPVLVQKSLLMQQSHVLVMATPSPSVPHLYQEKKYLESLFQQNPSYTYWTPPNSSHLSFCSRYNSTTHRNKNKIPVDYKQCLANYGVLAGLHLWGDYDWVIRLNPDVLVRQSGFFLGAMRNASLDALLIHCGEGTKQIHTDFWAIRPKILSNTSFCTMAKAGSHLNHERTAFREFRPTVAAGRHAWIPGMDPSNGVCRARGEKALVYHAHDSCTSDQDMVCHGLQGWEVGP